MGAKEDNHIKIEDINLDENEMFEAIFVKRDPSSVVDDRARAIEVVEVRERQDLLNLNTLLTLIVLSGKSRKAKRPAGKEGQGRDRAACKGGGGKETTTRKRSRRRATGTRVVGSPSSRREYQP